jgi:hypothetical protein
MAAKKPRPKVTTPADPTETDAATVTTIPTAKALMLEDLARSGLDEDAKTLGMVPLDAKDTAKIAGAANAAGRGSYRIPYFDAEGEPTKFYRLRFLGSPEPGKDKPPKYHQPGGTIPDVYLPPLLDRPWSELLSDPTVDLVITEGEKKSSCACKHGIPTIGLGGVWSFASAKHGADLIPGLASAEWKGRRCAIIHDADAASKPQVVSAALRLAAELTILGAEVRVGFPPAGGPKGIDDLLVARGPEALREVLDAAKPLSAGMWPLELAIPAKMFPHVQRDPKGVARRPLATIESVQTLLGAYGIEAAYNVITKVALYRGRGMDTGTGAGVQHGATDSALNRIVSQARLCGMATDDIQKTVAGIAYSRPVNPVLDYLSKLPAPKADEPDALLAVARKFTVPEHEREIRDATFRLWMIQACAAADYAQQTPISERRGGRARPTFEYVITLLGRQGVAKTSTLRSLLPRDLRDYCGTGVILNPDNKDSIERATGYWIAELGEIDGTVGKAAAASMKAFLSMSADVYRKSYGRERNSFPRQTVFAATGNILRSLRDITGSRRFWPLNVTAVDPLTDAEVERAWSQAWGLYLGGEQWWPTPELQKRLDAQVIDYAEEYPLGEKVLEVFGSLTVEAKKKRGVVHLSALRIMDAIGLAPDLKNQRDVAAARELGNWLARVNLNERGEPDRRKRSNMSEWAMPKRDDAKPRKCVA